MANPADQLKALFAAGRYEHCWQGAHGALLAGASDPWVFLMGTMSLVQLGRGKDFADVIRGSGPDSVLLATWTFSELLEGRAYPALVPMGDLFQPTEPYWLVAIYFSGCAAMMLGRHDEAMARFKAFRLAWPRFRGMIDFINDDRLNVMLRQGRLVADGEEVARRMKSAAVKVPRIAFVGEATEGMGRPVVFASGNNHYFNTMGPEFVKGMMPYLPTLSDRGEVLLHLHVIDPDAESHQLIEKLRGEHGARLGFSLESDPPQRTYTYYACSRFYVMTAMLDRYRAPVISFDIDIVPTQPIAPLFELAKPFDFCCYRTTRNEPASVFQASVMYWPDRPATRGFLDGLQHFCWDELGNPSRTSWMLDQAALFSLLGDPQSGLQFGDYAQLTGRILDDAVRITFSNQVKGELRHRVQLGEPTEVTLAQASEKG